MKKLLDALIRYLLSTRQTGHTELMLKGVNNTQKDCIVVVAKIDDIRTLSKRVGPKDAVRICCLGEIEQDSLRGSSRPLAIDNHALTALCTGALTQIVTLEGKVEALQEWKQFAKKLIEAYGTALELWQPVSDHIRNHKGALEVAYSTCPQSGIPQIALHWLKEREQLHTLLAELQASSQVNKVHPEANV